MSRGFDTKDGYVEELSHGEVLALIQGKFPHVEFFEMRVFHSPRGGETKWYLEWSGEAERIDPNYGLWENWYGSLSNLAIIADIRPATEEMVSEFRRRRSEVDKKRNEKLRVECGLLSLCGLVHEDFVRFRNVSREGDKLVVETRENGVAGRSSKAIRNPNYLESYPDRGDTTYEYYFFTIPRSVPVMDARASRE